MWSLLFQWGKGLLIGIRIFFVCLLDPKNCAYCANDAIKRKLQKKIGHGHRLSLYIGSGFMRWECVECGEIFQEWEDSQP